MRRRDFLLLAASSVTPRISFSLWESVDGKYIFSANNYAGIHYLSRVNRLSNDKKSIEIPFRAHDVLSLNEEVVVGFGRRPGMQCVKVDFSSGEITTLEASKGRHFYGHGCLSDDNKVLFTSENDYENARGVIGIRDVKTLKVIGEFPSYGIGPHDIHLMPDQKTLVVANGGVQTHPDFGRRQLNLKTMQSSLVYLGSQSGKKLGEYRIDDKLLSLRHLTVTAQGDVGVAAQFKGDIYRYKPHTLVAWQNYAGPLEALKIADVDLEWCRGYMADLAFDPKLQLLAVTSPRGNIVTFWDVKTQRYLYSVNVPEVSAIQYLSEQQRFLVSSATGLLLEIRATHDDAQISVSKSFANLQWDNHLIIA